MNMDTIEKVLWDVVNYPNIYGSEIAIVESTKPLKITVTSLKESDIPFYAQNYEVIQLDDFPFVGVDNILKYCQAILRPIKR